ncbi:hypothetical protein AUP68_06184 [Ilyonectria robusta]
MKDETKVHEYTTASATRRASKIQPWRPRFSYSEAKGATALTSTHTAVLVTDRFYLPISSHCRILPTLLRGPDAWIPGLVVRYQNMEESGRWHRATATVWACFWPKRTRGLWFHFRTKMEVADTHEDIHARLAVCRWLTISWAEMGGRECAFATPLSPSASPASALAASPVVVSAGSF